jgi:hypothetical protein
MHRPLRLLGLLGCALAGFACTGNIDPGAGASNNGNGNTGPGGPGPGDPNKPGPMTPGNPMAGALADTSTVAGSNPLRRLTLLEYRNTVRDLLGVSADQVTLTGITSDQASGLSGFVRGGALTTGDDARAFMNAADGATKLIAGKLDTVLPCKPIPTGAAEQGTCIDQFIEKFGGRAFRRPVAPAEAMALRKLYDTQRSADVGATFEQAVSTLVSSILQSPAFLYHWELGPNAPLKDGNSVRYNPYEMASKLSYLFWATMPDDKLFGLAAQGGLSSPEQIATEAQRLLGDPRAKDAIQDFHFQWLEIAGLTDMPKDPGFTDYSPAVAKAMVNETNMFVSSVFFGPKPTLETLFTSSTSFVDAGLAKLYGATAGGAGMQQVDLNPTQRAGLLTQGSFLAVKSDADVTVPPRRGETVLHRALCIDLEIPPNIVVPAVKDPNPMQTTRQRFEEHSKDPCATACHSVIDPIGFAFEKYDAVGAYRTTENSQQVDSSGTVELPKSGKITFKDAIELSAILSKAPETRDCSIRQWLRYALGRREVDTENPSLAVLADSFQKSNYNLRDLLVSITKTRAFTHRALSAGEAQ